MASTAWLNNKIGNDSKYKRYYSPRLDEPHAGSARTGPVEIKADLAKEQAVPINTAALQSRAGCSLLLSQSKVLAALKLLGRRSPGVLNLMGHSHSIVVLVERVQKVQKAFILIPAGRTQSLFDCNQARLLIIRQRLGLVWARVCLSSRCIQNDPARSQVAPPGRTVLCLETIFPSKAWMAPQCSHPASCQCASHPAPASQSLDELGFLKSACSAAQSGNLDRLSKLVEAHPDAVHTDGSGGTSGYTPLHYAARAGQTAALELLLEKGKLEFSAQYFSTRSDVSL